MGNNGAIDRELLPGLDERLSRVSNPHGGGVEYAEAGNGENPPTRRDTQDTPLQPVGEIIRARVGTARVATGPPCLVLVSYSER